MRGGIVPPIRGNKALGKKAAFLVYSNRMRCTRWTLVKVFLLSLVVPLGCATGGRVDPTVEPAFNWQPYGVSLATVARVSSRGIPDLSSRIFALIRTAKAAGILEEGRQEQIGLAPLSVSSLGRAQFLIQRVTNPLLQAELYSTLSRGYENLGRTAEALEVVTRGVDILVGILQQAAEPEDRTIQVLEDLIYTLFTLGPEGFDQLRRAIQRVYIVPDYGQRTLLLTQIVDQYQRQGAGQRANLLLQQSIAALDSISDPPLRVRGYGAVARRFFAQGDFDEAEDYAERTFGLLDQIDLGQLSPQQEEHLAQAVVYLIEMDYTTEAPGYIFRFPSLSVRQSLLSALSGQYFVTDQPFAAELILQQLIQQLSFLPGSSSYAYGILRIVSQYRLADDPLGAEFFLDQLLRNLVDPAQGFRPDDFLWSEVVVQALGLRLVAKAEEALARIDDSYLAILALDRALDGTLIGVDNSTFDWILEKEALLVTSIEPSRRDEGRALLAVGYAQAGKPKASIEILAQIENPYTLSLTASQLAELLPPQTGDQFAPELEAILSRFF